MAEGGGDEAGASQKVIFVHKRKPLMFDDMNVFEEPDSDVEMSGSDAEMEVGATTNKPDMTPHSRNVRLCDRSSQS